MPIAACAAPSVWFAQRWKRDVAVRIRVRTQARIRPARHCHPELAHRRCDAGILCPSGRSGWPGRLASAIAGRSLTEVSAPDVIEKIQRLNRLETVKYSLDTIVEGNESNPL